MCLIAHKGLSSSLMTKFSPSCMNTFFCRNNNFPFVLIYKRWEEREPGSTNPKPQNQKPKGPRERVKAICGYAISPTPDSRNNPCNMGIEDKNPPEKIAFKLKAYNRLRIMTNSLQNLPKWHKIRITKKLSDFWREISCWQRKI